SWVADEREDSKEADRSRAAAGGDQQGFGTGEVDSARSPLDAAPLVGAAAIGDGEGGDFRSDGRRPVGAPGAVSDGGEAGRREAAVVPVDREAGAVGEHDERGSAWGGARGDSEELAYRLCRSSGRSAGGGAVRSGRTSRLPRPVRRGWGTSARGA